ncbi:MAG: peptide/nickel transport system permease protein [Actinomycetota bacterium]|nr:peptide/nickel transport system permease protein [Actinomycetota bacterium]
MASGGGSLRAYVLARLLLAVPMLFILLTVTFVLLRVAPGDPVTATLGGRVSDARADQIRHDLGLDRPLWRQYTSYLADVAHGDFGRAITTNRPLRTTIADRFPATLELTLAAMVVAIGVGVFVGALAARFRDTVLDVGGRMLGILLYAAPIFWLGIMLQLLFSIQLHWLPTGGRIAPFQEPRSITHLYLVDALITGDWAALGSAFRYLILPAATLGMVIGGIFIRLVRVNMLQTLKSDYVEAARARGIGERRVLFNHAFRNALVPVVTIVGLQFALLLGGAVLTEATFTWPGIGLSLYQFLQNRDYTAVQGLVTFYALFVVGVSLLIDVVSAWVDPRIRFQ